MDHLPFAFGVLALRSRQECPQSSECHLVIIILAKCNVYRVVLNPCYGQSWNREQAIFDTKGQRASHKIGKGAGSRQMIILEQGAPKMIKRSMEQRKLLKRSMEQEKNPGARGKIKKEQGAQKNEKGAGKMVKKEQEAKN